MEIYVFKKLAIKKKTGGSMKRFYSITPLLLLILLLLRPLPGIAADASAAEAKSRIFPGEVKVLGNGVVWSWVKSDEKGNPMALGVTFTETALSGLPENPPADALYGWEYAVALPKQVVAAPFTHVGIDWNPHGHIPPGIYDVPHFDFHFYLITPKERDKITARGTDLAKCYMKPASKFIPAGYILPKGTEYPRSGVHWIDPTSPEFNKQPFTLTFIYGSYNGHITFIEPMITRAFLETKPDIVEPIKLPAAYQKRGYYPTAYSVKYDPVRREYTIALEAITRR